MQRREAIKVEALIPLTRGAEAAPSSNWIWWHSEMLLLRRRLTGSQKPGLSQTNSELTLIWIVLNEAQLDFVKAFLEETRRRFSLDELFFHHHPVTRYRLE